MSNYLSRDASDHDSVDASDHDSVGASDHDSVDASDHDSVDTSDHDSVDASDRDSVDASDRDLFAHSCRKGQRRLLFLARWPQTIAIFGKASQLCPAGHPLFSSIKIILIVSGDAFCYTNTLGVVL
jgi:hypothetical protein